MSQEARADDASCIAHVLQGEKEAFAPLVCRYQGAVYSVCLQMTKNCAEAEELAQEVFWQAYSSLSTFRHESGFSTWLYRIAVRKCLDWYRRQERLVQKVPLDDALESRMVASENPEEIYFNKLKKQRVDALLKDLGNPYEEVVRLYYLEQLSCQEIAVKNGVSTRTVESQLYRARKRLKGRGVSSELL